MAKPNQTKPALPLLTVLLFIELIKWELTKIRMATIYTSVIQVRIDQELTVKIKVKLSIFDQENELK